MRLTFLAASVVVAAGCSGGDPGAITLGHGNFYGGSDPDAAATGDDASVTTTADSGGGGGDSSVSMGGDASVSPDSGTHPADAGAHDSSASPDSSAQPDASPPPTNAFSGAPGYVGGSPPIQSQSQHNTSIAGTNCGDCHGGANPSSGKRFDWAGRVFADANGTTPAVGVEVRVIDHNGVTASAYSDSSGYFYHPAATDLTIPALAGARNGTSTNLMVGTLSDATKRGSCNACHDGTTTSYLHVP